jgi:hypothetical protein
MLPEGHRSLARHLTRTSKLRERGRRIGLALFLAVQLPAVTLLSVTFLRHASTPEEPSRRARAPVARTTAGEPAAPVLERDAIVSPGPDLATTLSARVREAIADDSGTYGVAVYEPRSCSSLLHNADRRFFAASLGKHPTPIAFYRRPAARSAWTSA